MSKASVYFRVIIHWWIEDGKILSETMDDELFALECKYKFRKGNLLSSESAVGEDFLNTLQDEGFIRDVVGENSDHEGYVEVVGEFSVTWTRDYEGEVDSDVEWKISERYFLDEEDIKEIVALNELEE